MWRKKQIFIINLLRKDIKNTITIIQIKLCKLNYAILHNAILHNAKLHKIKIIYIFVFEYES